MKNADETLWETSTINWNTNLMVVGNLHWLGEELRSVEVIPALLNRRRQGWVSGSEIKHAHQFSSLLLRRNPVQSRWTLSALHDTWFQVWSHVGQDIQFSMRPSFAVQCAWNDTRTMLYLIRLVLSQSDTEYTLLTLSGNVNVEAFKNWLHGNLWGEI